MNILSILMIQSSAVICKRDYMVLIMFSLIAV